MKSAAITLSVLMVSLPLQAATFQGLGSLGGSSFRSEASAVSNNGVVVGFSAEENGFEAFRWTLQAGMQGIGSLLANSDFSSAEAISADGSTIVGESQLGSNMRAFRWTEASGIEVLPLPFSVNSSDALAVSADGTVIAGYQDNFPLSGGRRGFRWSAVDGLQDIGPTSSSLGIVQPNAISADGDVIVGDGSIYTVANGVQLLSDPTNPSASARAALGISADGRYVVGAGNVSTDGEHPFRWTQEMGFQVLDNLPGTVSVARSVSADGRLVVGDAESAQDQTAFIWDAVHGTRDLKSVLTDDYGLNLDDWTLLDATAVSSDGQEIVGFGVNPAGDREAWIAILPEPDYVMAISAFAVVLTSRRPRR